MTPKPAQLPPEFRAVTWIALIVAGLIGFVASAETMSVLSPASPEQLAEATPELMDKRLTEALTRTQHEVTQAMRGPRAAVLLFLSFICGMVVVSAIRLLYPVGLPREGMRRITGGALLIAGLLRTVDGAMQLVISQRTGAALRKELEAGGLGIALEGQPNFAPALLVGFNVAVTVFMVAVLVGSSQYLRSQRAKGIVQTVDAATFGPTAS